MRSPQFIAFENADASGKTPAYGQFAVALMHLKGTARLVTLASRSAGTLRNSVWQFRNGSSRINIFTEFAETVDGTFENWG